MESRSCSRYMPGCPVCHSDSSWRLGKVGCIRSTAWRATYDLHLQRIHSERQLGHDDHDNSSACYSKRKSHDTCVRDACLYCVQGTRHQQRQHDKLHGGASNSDSHGTD